MENNNQETKVTEMNVLEESTTFVSTGEVPSTVEGTRTRSIMKGEVTTEAISSRLWGIKEEELVTDVREIKDAFTEEGTVGQFLAEKMRTVCSDQGEVILVSGEEIREVKETLTPAEMRRRRAPAASTKMQSSQKDTMYQDFVRMDTDRIEELVEAKTEKDKKRVMNRVLDSHADYYYFGEDDYVEVTRTKGNAVALTLVDDGKFISSTFRIMIYNNQQTGNFEENDLPKLKQDAPPVPTLSGLYDDKGAKVKDCSTFPATTALVTMNQIQDIVLYNRINEVINALKGEIVADTLLDIVSHLPKEELGARINAIFYQTLFSMDIREYRSIALGMVEGDEEVKEELAKAMTQDFSDYKGFKPLAFRTIEVGLDANIVEKTTGDFEWEGVDGKYTIKDCDGHFMRITRLPDSFSKIPVSRGAFEKAISVLTKISRIYAKFAENESCYMLGSPLVYDPDQLSKELDSFMDKSKKNNLTYVHEALGMQDKEAWTLKENLKEEFRIFVKDKMKRGDLNSLIDSQK